MKLTDVIRRPLINFDLNQLGAAGVHAEGVGERFGRERDRHDRSGLTAEQRHPGTDREGELRLAPAA